MKISQTPFLDQSKEQSKKISVKIENLLSTKLSFTLYLSQIHTKIQKILTLKLLDNIL